MTCHVTAAARASGSPHVSIITDSGQNLNQKLTILLDMRADSQASSNSDPSLQSTEWLAIKQKKCSFIFQSKSSNLICKTGDRHEFYDFGPTTFWPEALGEFFRPFSLYYVNERITLKTHQTSLLCIRKTKKNHKKSLFCCCCGRCGLTQRDTHYIHSESEFNNSCFPASHFDNCFQYFNSLPLIIRVDYN